MTSWSWDGWIEATATEEISLHLLPYYFTRDETSRITSSVFGTFDTDTDKHQGGFDFETRVDRPVPSAAARAFSHSSAASIRPSVSGRGINVSRVTRNARP